jgi:hypothetical protein
LGCVAVNADGSETLTRCSAPPKDDKPFSTVDGPVG